MTEPSAVRLLRIGATMMRVGLALVAVVLIGLLLMGIGMGAGVVHISADGVTFGREQVATTDGDPKARVVSADDLLVPPAQV